MEDLGLSHYLPLKKQEPLLSGEFHEGDLIRVDRAPDGLTFTPLVQAEVVEE